MTNEFLASDGLDIKHFPFKWKKAQQLASDEALYDTTGNLPILPYWERVRQLYLELGGEKIREATHAD